MKQTHCITIIVITLVFAWLSVGCGRKNGPAIHRIAITEPVDGVVSGAALAESEHGSDSRVYNTPLDFYNGNYDSTVMIIKKFRTYQQTSEYSCGPACLVMLLDYYGMPAGENTLAKEVDARNQDNPRADGSFGTTTDAMKKALERRKFTVQSSSETADISGCSFPSIEEFTEFLKKQISKGDPVITENIEWGGHWMIIIGYDDMGTKTMLDDTLIFADPYDVSDQYQDGYITKNCYRFFSEWFDSNILPEKQRKQQYITVISE